MKIPCELYFVCSLQDSNCQTWVFAIPVAHLLINCYSTRHSSSLVFLQLCTVLT